MTRLLAPLLMKLKLGGNSSPSHMKVPFAARMARFDLLRATRGLASRVTTWSPECDKSLHRLTVYPLTAFSKKQTSTAMSSTEAEVTAANLALRAVGLPSSCLWSVIRQAGGERTKSEQKRWVETRAKNPKDDSWEHVPFTNEVSMSNPEASCITQLIRIV